ncbi:MAG: helix-turn-helix domain-containing protein [Vallitaleaceae bacterium]|nr:helix-turn-helix domain-containing protein [Vallitaleaceae bacterium]
MLNTDKPSPSELAHHGMPKRSGRYPWGSGKEPYQRSGDFLSRLEELKKQGLNDTQIAETLGLNSTQLRVQRSLAREERRSAEAATALELREKGYSLNAIAEKMGYNNDSSIRSLLNKDTAARSAQAKETYELLKKHVDEKGMIDVGTGIERELNISKEKLNQALYMLEREGYPTYSGGVPQVTNPGSQTSRKVLCPPGTEHKEIYEFDKVSTIENYTSHDGGETFDTFKYPKSLDSKRVGIRYAEDGGIDKDGVIEIRRGVDDLSLGNSHYAQVRILVDDTKYLKGMAVYSDNMPDGVDIVFNTNKGKDTPKDKVMKDITADPDNPFGSLIKANGQRYYTDENGNKQLSPINKRAEEGDWKDWDDKLPSQFLGKQNLQLIKNQLNMTYADKAAEFDEINSLTNPTIKKVLLKSFADDCDAAAVHLKAAALPGQKYQVILPLTSITDKEVYAPNFENGSKVALIRFPHGGTFEIPIVTVNNKNKEGQKILGTTPADAVGINSKVAERLSGADFDGDTVMVVPVTSRTKITSTPALKGLEGFDPKMTYGADEVKKNSKGEDVYYRNGKPFKVMKATQLEMGKASNLITDMTLKGAPTSELAKAVRHSMVVIDAEKHKLNYKQSEVDNDIAFLKKRYQGTIGADGRYHEGAATLLSRAKSETAVLKRKGSPKINKVGTDYYDPSKPEGALLWKSVEETYEKVTTNRKGVQTVKVITKTQKSTKMAETDDAYTLSSGTTKENAYADYANKMKALGNTARKTMVYTDKLKYDPEARKTYKQEVNRLDAALNVALKNAPRERQAQAMANSIVKAKKLANPEMTKAEIKKANQQEITKARIKYGAKRELIEVSDREWEAIQKGAISENQLMKILNNTNLDSLKQRALPRTTKELSTAKINKIKTMKSSGSTNAEIANALGVSSSTVSDYLKP